LMPTQLIISNQ